MTSKGPGRWDRLAILGGEPLRRGPFLVTPMVDEAEEEMVLSAIREANFSRYIGARSADIEEILRMPSAAATGVEAYWHYLGGRHVRAFSAEFAARFGSTYAVPVNSCTSGLSVALAAVGCGPGDEVIVPCMSFTATGTSVVLFDSVPVFADVDPRTFVVTAETLRPHITPRTKAILVVHLLGNACDMDAISALAREHGLRVIEDCAQAPGTRYKGRYVGTLGDAGVFSFQQSKNIMTGEGGMILTDDPEIARFCRMIINHGECVFQEGDDVEAIARVIGCNFRMTELQAALGRAQLPKLDAANAWRNRNARYLIEALGDVPGFTAPYVKDEVDIVYHILGLLYDAEVTGLPRDLFVAALRAEGIPVGTSYERLMQENPLFSRRAARGALENRRYDGKVSYSAEDTPVANRLIREQFLWYYHIAYSSTLEDMRDIVDATHKVLYGRDELLENADVVKGEPETVFQTGRVQR